VEKDNSFFFWFKKIFLSTGKKWILFKGNKVFLKKINKRNKSCSKVKFEKKSLHNKKFGTRKKLLTKKELFTKKKYLYKKKINTRIGAAIASIGIKNPSEIPKTAAPHSIEISSGVKAKFDII